MVRYKILWMVWVPVLFSQASAQNIISGTVRDGETGKVLPGVNVYFANTTIGTGTGSDGSYQIRTKQSGTFELVFSFVGYKSKVASVNITDRTTKTINAELNPHTYTISEVKVSSSNKNWERNYERFKDAFIGKTEFARETVIENPWVIDFTEENRNTLVADAREPLIIINRALGYKLHVELLEFKWLTYEDSGVYKIYPRFKPLSARSKEEKLRWWENRIEAYLGSFTHFLKSLYGDAAREAGFSIKNSRRLELLPAGKARFQLFERGVSLTRTVHYKGYKITREVQVSYRDRATVPFDKEDISFSVRKKGRITANTENEIFFIRENGTLLDPGAVTVYDDWAKNRIADSLPENYKIGN